MKKGRFTEEQIAFALRQAETGTAVAEVIRKMGISEQTFYRWKKQYAGMGVAELRRMKQLEEENRRLKQLGPISPWTSRFFRMFSQKNSKACSKARAGGVSFPVKGKTARPR